MHNPRRSSLPLCAALIAAGLATGGAAHADEALEADAGAMIIVTAARDPGYLAARTSSATRTDTALLDVPQTVDILTRDRLDDQAFLSIADALRYVPGATTGQGEGHRDQPTLRGNNSTADFFVDGLRDDVQYYRDFYNIERLEIMKGPNAMIFGRGGGGGVINRVAKTPQSDSFAAAAAGIDSFGAWRVGADINAVITDGISARINAVHEDGANHRDVYDMQRWAVNPTLGFTLGARGNLVIGYEHARDDRIVDRGVPALGDRPASGFRDTFFGLADVNRSTFNADVVSLALDYALTDNLTLRQRSRYGDYDKFYGNLFPATALSTANSIGVEAYTDAIARENLLTQTDLVWKGSTGGIDHTLLVGVELGRQTTTSARVNGSFPVVPGGTALRTPVAATDPFRPPAPTFGAPLRRNHSRASIAAGFIQNQLSIGEKIEIVAGLRYDRFSLDFDNLLNGATLARTDNLWSPRLGLVLKPAADASLYASFSRSYLPQSGDQFTALDATTAALEPERFDNYEIGAKWDVVPGLNLTAALYQLDRTNSRAAGPAPGTLVLTGKQRSKGLELAANGKITPQWQLSAGFAWQDAEILNATIAGPAGRKVAMAPRTQASLWTRYDLSDRFGLGLGVSHQASSFASISNAVVLPAYTRVDAAAFLQVARGIDVQVNIENLFNTGYFPTAHNDNNISTGGPRAARLTLRTKY
jgi:catecholate siderophore receptor